MARTSTSLTEMVKGSARQANSSRKIIRDTVEIPGRDRYIFRQGAIPLDTQGTAAAAELGVAEAADLTVTAGIQVRLADDTLSNGEAQALPYRFHYGTYKLVPHDDGRAAVSAACPARCAYPGRR